ncbi:MAG: hypothetical protein HLUCCO02_09605 [Idiomarinaceae bacterium HL-53]|nr:MAG: hypothetical protein HLUCCO02_09605 [Idiomarinaceae bacterium HL-53]CUS47783.1 hypothetical protein Ga0003345_0717 [Idiomarinaceae bacterium HL-53]
MGSILFIIIVVVIFIAVLVYRAANKKPQEKTNSASESESAKDSEQVPEPLPEAEQTPLSPTVPEALEEIASELEGESDPLVRHRMLSQLTEKSYKHRKDEEYRKACIHFSALHIQEFEEIVEPLKEASGGKLPQVMTFQNYANLLLELEQFEDAIKVCEQALEFGLDDKTQTGFEGRIQRIRAKQNKAG